MFRSAVPSLFGARNRFHGKEFFYGPGWGWGGGVGMIKAHYLFILFPLLLHQLYLRSSGIRSQRLAAAAAKSLHSCLTLCDPIDSSPPGSVIPGILPARTLEWAAIAFSAQRLGTPAVDGLASWEVYSMVGSLYGQLFTGSSYMAYIKS